MKYHITGLRDKDHKDRGMVRSEEDKVQLFSPILTWGGGRNLTRWSIIFLAKLSTINQSHIVKQSYLYPNFYDVFIQANPESHVYVVYLVKRTSFGPLYLGIPATTAHRPVDIVPQNNAPRAWPRGFLSSVCFGLIAASLSPS